MRLMTCCLLVSGLWIAPAGADETDPIGVELGQAKVIFQEAVEKAKAKLTADFQIKLMEVAAKKGDLKVVKELKAEQEAFEKDGTPPTSAWMKAERAAYVRALRNAGIPMASAYVKARDAYTRAADVTRAEAIVKEFASWKAEYNPTNPKPGKEEPYVVGTWAHEVRRRRKVVSRGTHKFYSNGGIGSPKSKATWTVKGNVLILRWPKGPAAKAFWEDVCTLSADGASYAGRNQEGARIVGVRISGPEKDTKK